MTAKQGNTDQAWSDASAAKWVRLQERTDAQLGALGLFVIDRLAPAPGERVLDVGCGAGQTVLQLAERVGSEGSVVGLDISAPMLARARERVSEAGLSRVELVLGDAATQRFERPFNVLFSRFGVMFFEDPVVAFTNLRAALRPGGRLGFVSWQAPELNPWVGLTLNAARKIAPQQALPALLEPGRPGPFFLADAAFVRRVLHRAGFTEIAIEPREVSGPVGGARTLDEAVEFSLEIGPTARFVSEADPALVPAMRAAVRDALSAFDSERGVWVAMRILIVTARR
jgi:SAM-dependent methyltransferase